MIRRVTCISALVVALLAMSVPAASAASVSPDTWAPKFCSAMSDWQQTITDKGDAMSTELTGLTDLKEARSKIATFLDDMVTATDHATSAIKKAGSPSSPNGDKISAVFVKGFQQISKLFAKAEKQAEKLPTSSAAAFKAKGKALGQAISGSSDELSKNFASVGKLDKGKKLSTAVQNAPECAFLNS
jgi:hypothetical protein